MKLVRERVTDLVRHYRYKVSVLSLTKMVIYAQVAHIDNRLIDVWVRDVSVSVGDSEKSAWRV